MNRKNHFRVMQQSMDVTKTKNGEWGMGKWEMRNGKREIGN